MPMQNDNHSKESLTNSKKIKLNRRNLLKLAVTSTTIGGATTGAISLSSSTVSAQIETESTTEQLDVTNEAIAGIVNGLYLTDETTFTVEYEDLIRGDIIELDLYAQLDEINGGPINYHGLESVGEGLDRYAKLGSIGIQVDSSSGEITIDGSDFFENREQIDILEQTAIDPSHIQVDLDVDPDYKRESKIKLLLTGHASDNSRVIEKQWNLNVTIEALLGFGIFFGEEFGVST